MMEHDDVMPISISSECEITRHGKTWKLFSVRFRSAEKSFDVVCASHGPIEDGVFFRINSPCLTSEVFEDSSRCDCRDQLTAAMDMMADTGSGVLIYNLDEEARGHGILNKLNSYKIMSDEGLSTKKAFEKLGLNPDVRTYNYVNYFISHFRLKHIKLLTNNPDKISAFSQTGVSVKRVPIVVRRAETESYLKSKANELGHAIEFY